MAGPNYERTDKGEPIADAARQWDGWGTALKPAYEPIIVARKPFRGTVATNIQEHGTGAINVDACRIEGESTERHTFKKLTSKGTTGGAYGLQGHEYPVLDEKYPTGSPFGRWPANVILDEDAAAALDEQTGVLTSGAWNGERTKPKHNNVYGTYGNAADAPTSGSTGGASRFFYTAKASRSEREIGMFGVSPKATQRYGSIRTDRAGGYEADSVHRNNHPTVKPIDLMTWLIRMVTPPGGVVLDPFLGSGTTGIAASRLGFDFIGIELNPEYLDIARRRIHGDAPLFANIEVA